MKNTILRHTFDFGKIAYCSNRKTNRVTVVLEIKEEEREAITIDGERVNKYLTLSICGNIWNSRETDIVSGGQNLDEILKCLPHNPTVRTLHKIWKKWHLNDMKAGTRRQLDFINYWKQENRYEYSEAVKALEEMGLYNDNGFRYGSSWYLEPLPDSVIGEVNNLVLSH